MKIRVQVIVESDNGIGEIIQEIAQLERGQLRPEELGLTLAEAKGLLEGLQRTVVEQQIAEYSKQQSSCSFCSKPRSHKGAHTIVFRTIFGKIELSSPRLFHCQCQPQPTRSFSPLAELLVERTAPELLYLEAKFASLVSYGLSMKLFEEVLPIGAEINASTIRNHTLAVAERLESELGDEQAFFIEGCERDWEEMPRPEMPLTVGIDGGYVDSCEQKGNKGGCFEVIVGKSVTAEGESKCFGLVNSYDTKPKRRVFEALKSQGMQMNQQITFLSDGGDTVRELQLYLNPQAEHLLDWFHVSMRLTVMNQMAKGLGPEESESRAEALKQLESIKWYLWHGNVFKALRRIDYLEAYLEGEVITGESSEKLRVTLQEFQTYIENNQQWIPNYDELWRAGETISTAFVESAVNQVLSKRFVKKQQMSWSRRGAHLLLQVRTRVLNEELREKFDEWYPGFNAQSDGQARAA
jgi:hypothetical protein